MRIALFSAFRAAAIATLCLFALVPQSRAQVNVLTQHNDGHRTGANLSETVLTTSNVNSTKFGKLFSLTTDGQVYAQPLYVSNVAVAGKGTHNVLYVATAHDTVFAFDADNGGAALWTDNLGPSIPNTDLTFAGASSCNPAQTGPYPDMGPEIGIASTPVIDLTTNTLYCLSRSHANSIWTQKLHALDITSGAEKFGGPVAIPTPVTPLQSMQSQRTFDLAVQNQRAALALANGAIYICWASHGDCGGTSGYNGWVMNFDAATLAFRSAFCDTPTNDPGMAGIWMTGQGPAIDDTGNVYVSTGNGSPYGGLASELGTPDFGSSFIKFGPGTTLSVADYFIPYNMATINSNDWDLASTGVLLLPGTTRMVGLHKGGELYLIDTTNMTHFHAGSDLVTQEFPFTSNLIYSSPVYWNSAGNGPTVYISAAGDPIKALKYAGGVFQTTPISQSPFSVPAGEATSSALSVSANGSTAGTGILWAAGPISADPAPQAVPGILHAFDASNLATELWNSQQVVARDALGNYAKFTPPTIANGKVYAPTFSGQIVVYGILPPGIPAAPTGLTATAGNAQVALSWTASTGATSYNVLRSTVSGSGYASVATGIATTNYTNTGLTNGTTYYFVVSATNTSGTSGNSAQASATPISGIPAAPTGLTATAGNAQVTLSWTASTGATSYNVLRSTVSGSGYASVATGIATTNYTNTGLTNGTTYYFVVSATNTSGTSGNSNQASATPQAAGGLIKINAGGPVVSPFVADVDFSGGTAFTNWTGAINTSAVASPAPQAVYQSERYGGMTYTMGGLTPSTNYTVRLHFCENYWSAIGQRKFTVAINSTNVLTSFDIFATAGAQHKANIQQFTATANGSGQIAIAFANVVDSALINGIEINALSAPPPPTGLTATPGNTQVALSWTASSGATSYNVKRGTVNGSGYVAISSPTATNYTNTGLTNGTTYYFVVTAVNTAGESGNSNQASGTPQPGIPPAPTGLTATPGNTLVSLTWTASSGATSYNVLRSTVNGSGYASVASGISVTNYTNTGLTNGTAYYFVVTATNTSGTSGNSNQASATPQPAIPAAPTGLTATPGNAQVALSWTASTGATSYNVLRSTVSGSGYASVASGIATTNYTNTGLTNGTTYYFVVTATNASGTSGNSNQASATPSAGGGGTLLASEPFAEATGALHNANGGTGWSGAWDEQNGNVTVPGYNVSTGSLSYSTLTTSGNHGIGGIAYETSGRGLNVSTGGPFAAYLTGGNIGLSGKTLWMSALIRKDAATEQVNSLMLHANSIVWNGGTGLVSLGYFGAASDNAGSKYWTLEIGSTVYRTTVPITVGTTALLVLQINFGATNTVSLYVNPASLGGSAPGTATISGTTTSSIAFKSLAYYGGDGTNQSSIDEIRFGDTYAAVTQ